MSNEITMSAKFAGKCSECGFKFDAGAFIKFNTFKRTAKHVKCPEPDYSGSEQISIFETWVQRAQESEANNGYSDKI